MTDKTEHRFVGWGYDSSMCERCGVDSYDLAIQHARLKGGGKYCEDLPAEQAAYEESERTKPERKEAALAKVKAVLSEEEYRLLNLTYFGPYIAPDKAA